MKPVDPARLAAALEKLRGRAEGAPGSAPVGRTPREAGAGGQGLRARGRALLVRRGEIHPPDESEGNYTRVHFAEAQPQLFRSLNAMEERLDPHVFFRANRRQIINLAWIDRIEPCSAGVSRCTSRAD